MAAPSLIAAQPAALPDREATASARKEDLPERPEYAAPCTPRAMRPPERPQARVPASVSAPEWVHAPALVSAQVPAERPDSCRLLAKRRVRSVPAPMHAVAASNIRRAKKAR